MSAVWEGRQAYFKKRKAEKAKHMQKSASGQPKPSELHPEAGLTEKAKHMNEAEKAKHMQKSASGQPKLSNLIGGILDKLQAEA
ncbi:hypothetical protein T484DRAFT_1857513 [Baffinella frigidus]|nr:hypothetical protein T484DRAFT_1857513 [Cryptophyta sp. CCMP2293]